MIHNIKHLFKNKNKTILFAALVALLFLSCANDLSKTDTAVTGIHVNSVGDSLSVVKGDTSRLQAKVLPEEASDKSLSFSSDDAEIASVDAKGLITAHEEGNTVITIRAANGVQKTIDVTVTAAPVRVTSIEFNPPLSSEPIELFLNEIYKFDAKAMPEEAPNKKLKFETSNSSIAWLCGEGNSEVKADGEGDATVTITSDDNPSVSVTVQFKMKRKPAGPSISIETPSIEYESNEADVTFTVKTLNGKLDYTPEVVRGGTGEKVWLTFVRKDETNENTDTVHLSVKKNKTVWGRTAYIKFKDNNTNKYVKAAGKELQVELTQKKNENPTVRIQWVHGVTPPNEAEKHRIEIRDTGTYHEMPYVFTWDETMTTTFFNTRKVTHTGAPHGGFRDGNQCWAKTDANMLHWWFEQNKDNIKKYIEKKSITGDAVNMYKPYYIRGLANNEEHKKSSIANLFREKFFNYGGNPANGLQWYLFGFDGLKNTRPNTSSPALFKDIFNKDNTPIKQPTIYTKKEFEDTIKDALNSEKAVGLNRYGVDTSQHAITLWGAAFDEDDNIIAVYVVDNNDVSNRVFPYGIWYKKGVDIYVDSEPEIDQNDPHRFNPYFINYSNNSYNANYYIGEITTLDKGEAQWQAWLTSH